jgi:hypothetical protein
VISDLDPEDLRGFTFPIKGGCLPSRDEVMPNAPREYRSGMSEGIDFYHGDACTEVHRDLPVWAMFARVVIRADRDYDEITEVEANVYSDRALTEGFTDSEVRDASVVVNSGSTTAMASSAVTPDTSRSSLRSRWGCAPRRRCHWRRRRAGTPEATIASGSQSHLHIEAWVGDGFLDQQFAPDEVRRLYQRFFTSVGGAGGVSCSDRRWTGAFRS